MGTLQSLIRPHRLDALGAWAVTGILMGGAGRFAASGEFDWAVLTALLVAVAVTAPFVTRDLETTVPAELLGLVAVPVLVRAFGGFPQVTPFLVVAGVALLLAVVLDAHTSLTMTPRFATVFVVIVTMAVAGVWAVSIYATDTLLGTAFLDGQTELMWDLVTATVAGIVAGVVFELYFERSARIARLRVSDPDSPAVDQSGASLPGDGEHHRLAVRALQAVLSGISLFALVQGNVTLFVNSGGPLAITFLPALFRREYGYAMDTGLVLWITVASTLHGAGAFELYEAFGWYDSLAHAVSASLIAGVGYAIARAVERHSGAVDFNREFRATFVVLFVLAVGVGWEILEFASGGIASVVGGEAVLAQYGTGDIVNDLVFNTVGALIVAGWSTVHFEGIAARLTGRVGRLASGD
ncbi:hypothetical protein Har1130_01975 [Haloarcula sp. CBA1130]|uniref:DUF2238 domain-containing protein n=1 Tax=unclassified Haloarcula TaxID=2624677 RepID=UPI001247C45B|nr:MULTISPECIES: DUF2238 domain-containing protein [unclassified Haloarcula]KAA9399874.1 hypothetical protein Har1129_17250 [Haloarcula sp. CBA1129]KAA9401569.1 hypothetical protein Har1130_01975 [Haloarcula sp. CBA1130]